MNEIMYKEKTLKKTLFIFTPSEKKSLKYFISPWNYYTRCSRRFKRNGRIQF